MSENPYIRIGTSYYKIVKYPTISGDYIETIILWSIEAIRQDESKDLISQIPKYDGFTCIPNHVDYRHVYGTFYNTYAPLSVKPVPGSISFTENFLRHIFGKQFELGLDYLQLLYLKPTQILPILCLVSRERATGKSTFLKWLKCVFESNMTYLTNDSFSSQFNADWANKLLICIDEVLFNKEELTERIKYLSTTNINKMEAKGKDRREVEFFGKFVLCSNNEESFIKIDADEIRFWIIKVPRADRDDTSLLEKLAAEIPAFLHFLRHRTISVPEPLSRMWFSVEQIRTKALMKLIHSNRDRVEKELAHMLLSVMEQLELTEVQACPLDLLNLLQKVRVKADQSSIRRILKSWQIQPRNNTFAYQRVIPTYDGGFYLHSDKGRYYTITRAFLTVNFDELMTE
ncbi:DUF5906 domain-containing protein [Alistipes sp. OttesenSCG-928-L06]|nr:DUF5906 domain-containing protein [Alistipes sp. OttesenSCG-928-L06]